MQDNTPHYHVGIDIGTYKTRCLIGSLDPAKDEPTLSVIGYGQAKNNGMRKGLVVHMDDVVSSINQAVSEAERMAGIQVKQATVNINGSHISGQESKGVVAISAANREITFEDKQRVEEAATVVSLPANREIIQVFPKNYRVDGHDIVKDPQGMRGVRLEVDTHIITAALPNIRNLDSVMEKAQINTAHHTVSGLAAAEAVLTRKQKEAGTLVIDIGSSTTNLAVMEDGEVQHVSVIPLGGNNLTNDLAIGLKTDLDIAEKVKLEHATLAKPEKNKNLSVQEGKNNHVFEANTIYMITEARMAEILELVDKHLKKINRSRRLPGGVVIVGGTANIPDIAEFSKDKLQLAARVGKVYGLDGIVDDIQGSDFITAIGLMQLDMLMAEQAHREGLIASRTGGLLGKLKAAASRIKA